MKLGSCTSQGQGRRTTGSQLKLPTALLPYCVTLCQERVCTATPGPGYFVVVAVSTLLDLTLVKLLQLNVKGAFEP